MEPPEEAEDGVGETGGTGIAEEAEKVWEGRERAGDGGTLGVRGGAASPRTVSAEEASAG